MPVELVRKSEHSNTRPLRSTAELSIGLVVNMPDPAREATERQFSGLLRGAAGDRCIRLYLSSVPENPRAPAHLERMRDVYWPIDELLELRPDALIVTGMEPGPGPLRTEPYWNRLASLVDWSQANTATSLWSCLAAHAAVEHLHGIARRRLERKCFGVFEHVPRSEHELTEGVSWPVHEPHSRWNEVPEDALRTHGYRILSASAECGCDLFVHEGRSLLVFFQGHPEYESTSLLKEYRRDVGRYLRGEQAYPDLPANCLPRDQAAALLRFRDMAVDRRDPQLMREFPMLDVPAIAPWTAPAQRIIDNWLRLLAWSRG